MIRQVILRCGSISVTDFPSFPHIGPVTYDGEHAELSRIAVCFVLAFLLYNKRYINLFLFGSSKFCHTAQIQGVRKILSVPFICIGFDNFLCSLHKNEIEFCSPRSYTVLVVHFNAYTVVRSLY